MWVPTSIFVLCYYFFNPIKFPFESNFIDNRLFSAITLYTPSYLWIIRIFLLMSLITPFLINLINKYNLLFHLCVIFVLLVVNEILVKVFSGGYHHTILLMNIAYVSITYFGLIVSKLNDSSIFLFGLFFLCIFLLIASFYFLNYGTYISLHSLKYPPHIYYISYGMGCSLVLYSIRKRFSDIVTNHSARMIISFIGMNTLWIYLWHIPIISHFQNSFNWFVRFILIVSIPSIIVFLQTKIVIFYTEKYKLSMLKHIFTG